MLCIKPLDQRRSHMYQSKGINEFYQENYKEKISIIDVRERDEFAQGHIPKAINYPLSEIGKNFIEIDKKTEHYIICHSGNRSAMASEFLSQKGYEVVNVMGGMSAWRGETVSK